MKFFIKIYNHIGHKLSLTDYKNIRISYQIVWSSNYKSVARKTEQTTRSNTNKGV